MIPKLLLIALIAGIAVPVRCQICGPDVEHSTKKLNSRPELTAPPGKALLVVMAPTYEGGYFQMKLSSDRNWIGVNQYKSYFVATLEPGTHDLCSKSGDNVTHLQLTMEAGKSYFLRQDTVAKMGIGKPPTALMQLTAEDATVLLKKCRQIIFWEKGKSEPKN
jgi:hypothetical protein